MSAALPITRATTRLMLFLAAWVLAQTCAFAQDSAAQPITQSHSTSTPAATDNAVNPADPDPTTLFPHSETSRLWVSGQANVILQWHPAFHAAFSGPNSFSSRSENATSKLYTLYTGVELTRTTEVLVDFESAGGHGLSTALGVAGFTNLDVVRNPDLSQVPYLARFIVRQVIPLSSERVSAERGPLGLITSLPSRRIEIRAGKFSLVDFFDANTGGSDSHLQFLNWTVDNNGVYDYAANTRGYTDGVVIECDDHAWSVRFAEALMPKTANGIHLDADITRSRAENLEAEWRRNFLPGRAGVVRVLGFLNHADMGNYRLAINRFLAGRGAQPDITAVRRQGRHKYGFGLNFVQELTSQIGAFGRLGWSDGRNESFAYTEVDRAVELGSYVKGAWWRRRNDRAGAAFSLNAISGDHARYLQLGGLGFLLGDGGLVYGREKIFEGYYTAHVWRGVFVSFDLQHINNLGYNRARGPALVPGLRLHVDF